MNALKNFVIPFGGLSIGEHHYDFDVKGDFFGAFEASEISGGELKVHVALKKGATLLDIACDIEGEVEVECDRCLEQCRVPVSYQGELRVKFTDKPLAEGEQFDGDILWLSRGEGELDLARYIYESVVLSLPIQRFHTEGADGKPGCDPEMIARMNSVSEEEFRRMAADERAIGDTQAGETLRKLRQRMSK